MDSGDIAYTASDDPTVQRAQRMLRSARTALMEAERANHCCDAQRNQQVGRERKRVKRWETWLTDRSILEDPNPEAD